MPCGLKSWMVPSTEGWNYTGKAWGQTNQPEPDGFGQQESYFTEHYSLVLESLSWNDTDPRCANVREMSNDVVRM